MNQEEKKKGKDKKKKKKEEEGNPTQIGHPIYHKSLCIIDVTMIIVMMFQLLLLF